MNTLTAELHTFKDRNGHKVTIEILESDNLNPIVMLEATVGDHFLTVQEYQTPFAPTGQTRRDFYINGTPHSYGKAFIKFAAKVVA